MEQNKQPLLSICIPTFNRASVLKETLLTYIQNKEFNEDVELIISDNASTDETQEVCLEIVKSHSNIKYYRNEENIRDRNFIKVQNYANGKYIKLTNDWISPTEKSLKYIKDIIKKNIPSKRPIFFTNNYIFTRLKNTIIECNNLDQYIQAISTYVTSNNCFGAWKEHWESIENKEKYSKLMLQQVDWSYQIVSKFNGCILYDTELFFPIGINLLGKRSGYNWFQVHLDYYYKIMQPYIEKGFISPKTLKQDKLYLLKHFRSELIQIYTPIQNKNWQFDTQGTFKLLWKYYHNIPIFYFYILTYPFWGAYFCLKVILKKLLHLK